MRIGRARKPDGTIVPCQYTLAGECIEVVKKDGKWVQVGDPIPPKTEGQKKLEHLGNRIKAAEARGDIKKAEALRGQLSEAEAAE